MTKKKDYWNEQWIQFALELKTNKDYFVSNYGYIKSVDRITGEETDIKGSRLRKVYKVIGVSHFLAEKRACKTLYVHQIVAEAFCTNTFDADTKVFVIHVDGDATNNFFLNLKYVDREGLNEHFQKRGVWDPQKRKRSPAAKMNPKRVRLLRQRIEEGKTKKSLIAKSFNITLEQLRKIDKGIDWAWVENEEKTN